MARGGFRPGAGRRGKGSNAVPRVPRDVRRAAAAEGISPLEYMLSVMRNPEADQLRRDRMAMAAAPFVHAKAGDQKIGKKEQEQIAADGAGHGSEWASDLEFSNTQ